MSDVHERAALHFDTLAEEARKHGTLAEVNENQDLADGLRKAAKAMLPKSTISITWQRTNLCCDAGLAEEEDENGNAWEWTRHEAVGAFGPDTDWRTRTGMAPSLPEAIAAAEPAESETQPGGGETHEQARRPGA